MRALPRRNMFRLAAPIMIGAVAALGTALRAEGGSAPFYPPGLRHPGTSARLLRSCRIGQGDWGTEFPRHSASRHAPVLACGERAWGKGA